MQSLRSLGTSSDTTGWWHKLKVVTVMPVRFLGSFNSNPVKVFLDVTPSWWVTVTKSLKEHNDYIFRVMLSTNSAILEPHYILQNITIYQLTSRHNISEDFAVQQDNEPINNSSKFQSSVSYCMIMLMEPIQHQLTEWLASDKLESTWNWLWLHNGTLPAPSGTEEYPPPARKAHVLAKLLPRHLPNMSRALPLYQPGFETIHFMISSTPSMDLISRHYFLFRLLQKCLKVY